MFSYFKSKPKTEFNMSRTYIRIEFLTEQQKVQKDLLINDLLKDFDGDQETIVPYEDSFKVHLRLTQCSFRHTMNLPESFQGVLLLKDLIAHLEILKGDLGEFMEDTVEKILFFMQNDKSLGPETVIPLYSERDVFLYNPPEILEILYQKKNLWDRFKSTTKKVVKNLPNYFLQFFGKLFGYILGFMGLGSVSDILMTFFPMKVAINWMLTVLTMFFPMLGPLIGVGKMMI